MKIFCLEVDQAPLWTSLVMFATSTHFFPLTLYITHNPRVSISLFLWIRLLHAFLFRKFLVDKEKEKEDEEVEEVELERKKVHAKVEKQSSN